MVDYYDNFYSKKMELGDLCEELRGKLCIYYLKGHKKFKNDNLSWLIKFHNQKVKTIREDNGYIDPKIAEVRNAAEHENGHVPNNNDPKIETYFMFRAKKYAKTISKLKRAIKFIDDNYSDV